MKQLFLKVFFFMLIVSNLSIGQLYLDYNNLDKKDIIDALSFSGTNIFKFELEKPKKKCNFYLIIDEYAGKNNFIRTDTLLGNGHFKLNGQKVDSLRLISKIFNDSYDEVKLYISTPMESTWQTIKMDKKFSRKHYWIKFESSNLELNTKIPLLFYASEWDSIFMGKKVPRFCSLDRVPTDLSGAAINEVPHFYIISYILK